MNGTGNLRPSEQNALFQSIRNPPMKILKTRYRTERSASRGTLLVLPNTRNLSRVPDCTPSTTDATAGGRSVIIPPQCCFYCAPVSDPAPGAVADSEPVEDDPPVPLSLTPTAVVVGAGDCCVSRPCIASSAHPYAASVFSAFPAGKRGARQRHQRMRTTCAGGTRWNVVERGGTRRWKAAVQRNGTRRWNAMERGGGTRWNAEKRGETCKDLPSIVARYDQGHRITRGGIGMFSS